MKTKKTFGLVSFERVYVGAVQRIYVVCIFEEWEKFHSHSLGMAAMCNLYSEPFQWKHVLNVFWFLVYNLSWTGFHVSIHVETIKFDALYCRFSFGCTKLSDSYNVCLFFFFSNDWIKEKIRFRRKH